MATIALLDACVLYPAPLRDLLMQLARQGLFQPRWSVEIHDEWMRSVLKVRPDLSAAQLQRTRELMDQHAPDALVDGYLDLVPTLALPDPDDRHVLAAAIVGGASVLITFNLKDFPVSALDAHEIVAIDPDTFIERLIIAEPDSARTAASAILRRLRHPTMTADEYLDSLERSRLVRSSALLRGHI